MNNLTRDPYLTSQIVTDLLAELSAELNYSPTEAKLQQTTLQPHWKKIENHLEFSFHWYTN